jgi:hypothetical protein
MQMRRVYYDCVDFTTSDWPSKVVFRCETSICSSNRPYNKFSLSWRFDRDNQTSIDSVFALDNQFIKSIDWATRYTFEVVDEILRCSYPDSQIFYIILHKNHFINLIQILFQSSWFSQSKSSLIICKEWLILLFSFISSCVKFNYFSNCYRQFYQNKTPTDSFFLIYVLYRFINQSFITSN